MKKDNEEFFCADYSRSEAINLLNKNNPEKLNEANEKIDFLIAVGNEWLTKKTSNEEISFHLDNIIKDTENLIATLKNTKNFSKVIFLCGEHGLFGDVKKTNSNFNAYEEYLLKLEKDLKCLHSAHSSHKNSKRNSWMTEGYSHLDEFIGMCHWIFEEFRPNVAAISEENDFHVFCQEIFSLVYKEDYKKSLIGSLKKLPIRKNKMRNKE